MSGCSFLYAVLGGMTQVSNYYNKVKVSGNMLIFKDSRQPLLSMSVKIAANVEFVPMSGLDGSFVSFYNDNGKKAGTYVKNGRVWAMR
jgi:hypothetical protein